MLSRIRCGSDQLISDHAVDGKVPVSSFADLINSAWSTCITNDHIASLFDEVHATANEHKKRPKTGNVVDESSCEPKPFARACQTIGASSSTYVPLQTEITDSRAIVPVDDAVSDNKQYAHQQIVPAQYDGLSTNEIVSIIIAREKQ